MARPLSFQFIHLLCYGSSLLCSIAMLALSLSLFSLLDHGTRCWHLHLRGDCSPSPPHVGERPVNHGNLSIFPSFPFLSLPSLSLKHAVFTLFPPSPPPRPFRMPSPFPWFSGFQYRYRRGLIALLFFPQSEATVSLLFLFPQPQHDVLFTPSLPWTSSGAFFFSRNTFGSIMTPSLIVSGAVVPFFSLSGRTACRSF